VLAFASLRVESTDYAMEERKIKKMADGL